MSTQFAGSTNYQTINNTYPTSGYLVSASYGTAVDGMDWGSNSLGQMYRKSMLPKKKKHTLLYHLIVRRKMFNIKKPGLQ